MLPRSLIIILVIFLIYYVTKNLFRALFPYFMNKLINKGRADYREQTSKREGTVTVDKSAEKTGKRFNDGDGEYVNYEDVK